MVVNSEKIQMDISELNMIRGVANSDLNVAHNYFLYENIGNACECRKKEVDGMSYQIREGGR